MNKTKTNLPIGISAILARGAEVSESIEQGAMRAMRSHAARHVGDADWIDVHLHEANGGWMIGGYRGDDLRGSR